MSKKRRLGRGLEALLSVGTADDSDSKAENGPTPQSSTEKPEVNTPTAELSDETPSILPFTRNPNPTPSATGIPKRVSSDRLAPQSGSSAKASAHQEVQATPETTDSSEDVRASNSAGLSLDGQSFLEDHTSSTYVELNVYDIDDNPFQPRREFNKAEIESLAESLKTHEQLQPILVRTTGDRYQLISGERRLRAAIHAGWSKIRAQVRQADDRLVAELAIVENLQRKDLNPIEKALSFRRYIEEHGCSQDDLAGRLKIDRSTIANLLRLLELPAVVQQALQIALISNGHARALLPLGEEHLQVEFCNRIQREGLSVRATEQLVRDKIDLEDGVKPKPQSKLRSPSGQILALEKELKNAIGTRVEIKPSSRGKGKILVHYSSRDEFERLRQLLCEPGGSQNSDAA
ncbi:MAG: ParB/RepB/Spo0J family partition protein [Planctomycetota bacterium]|nr:ParB/RepB/Spo0J family partition protein [Planctomycetota bacterium]